MFCKLSTCKLSTKRVNTQSRVSFQYTLTQNRKYSEGTTRKEIKFETKEFTTKNFTKERHDIAIEQAKKKILEKQQQTAELLKGTVELEVDKDVGHNKETGEIGGPKGPEPTR